MRASWGADTAYDASEWSKDNPARGQCVVSSLIVQDYFGGDLVRYVVDEGDLHETHYMNRLSSDIVIDTTASQYRSPVSMRLKPVDLTEHTNIREKRLADDSTARRYKLLKQRVDRYVADNK